jgi:hypothetical protein
MLETRSVFETEKRIDIVLTISLIASNNNGDSNLDRYPKHNVVLIQ